jgi:ribonuclease J
MVGLGAASVAGWDEMAELGPREIRLVPLGGLGEIGMNCMALEQSGGIVVLDCGVAFPDNDLGVDVVHPDFRWLLERRERVHGVFLTHGHEDHVGALPYLLNELDVPVWGPPHALGMARRRLNEHDYGPDDLDFRVVRPREVHDVGPFSIEPVRVAHSIVEASALCIRTAAGTVVHTGDFNFDPAPPDGEPTDSARLSAIGDEGVALLLSDSTNIDVPERPGSELEVAESVERLVREAPKAVVVALFASNVQRLMTFAGIAERHRRQICLLGRSLENQVALATEIGRLAWPSNLMVSPEQAAGMDGRDLLVLAGGTQAEPRSALRRLASGEHPVFRLREGDTVILSSRIIPGNERPGFAMQNDLLRLGVTLHTRQTQPGIHTSGHAGRSEQRQMLELVRPRCFLPVHGTLHHLLRHAELAREIGVKETIVVENGTPVVCDGESLKQEPAVPHGAISIAVGGETASDDTLRERAELGRNGVVMVALALDPRGRGILPSVRARGVPALDDAGRRALAREAARALESHREGRGLTREELVRRVVRRKVEELTGARPPVEVLVSDVG